MADGKKGGGLFGAFLDLVSAVTGIKPPEKPAGADAAQEAAATDAAATGVPKASDPVTEAPKAAGPVTEVPKVAEPVTEVAKAGNPASSSNLHTPTPANDVKPIHTPEITTGVKPMATETKNTVDSAKFIFGKDGTVPITLEADGVKHTLDGTVWKGVNDAGDDVVIEGKRLTSALRKAGEGTKGVRLQPHAHDQLMTVAEDHGHLFTSSDNPFQHKLDVEPFREAYVHATSNPGELKELGGLMVGEEGAKAGQTPPHMKDLPKGVEDDFRRAQIRHDEKAFGRFREDITRGQKLQTEIAGINWQDAKFDKPGEAEKHLEAILAKHRHPEHGFDFVKQYGSTELDAKISAGTAHSGLEAAAEAFEGKVKTATTRLQAMAGDIKTLRTSITQNKKLFGDKDQLKADEAALEELGKEFDKYAGKSKAHAAAYAGLEAGDRAMLDSIASIKKSGATHSAGLATGATEAAKDAGKGSWFTHSAEELAKVAEKKGKSIEELGFFAKRTGWGKAAVIGVPVAVVGGVIAATGNKPGKYTQQAVNDNQLAQGAVVNR